MSQLNTQNQSLRRAYCIRPRPELVARLKAIGLDSDDTEFLCQSTVVMTEALPYEGKLEGFRALILKKCKEAFLNELFAFAPLSELAHREALFGKDSQLADAFELWWLAEEVETIEIQTTW